MANNVKVIVLGGESRVLDGVYDVKAAKDRTNTQTYTSSVDGIPASDTQVLMDGQKVTLSMQQKGGV